MKIYSVVFDSEAQTEALEAADYIARDAPDRAATWFTGLKRAVESLTKLPARCPLARESKSLGQDLHQLIYHSHRIIFRIEEDSRIVRILHVRHAAQRTLGERPFLEEDG